MSSKTVSAAASSTRGERRARNQQRSMGGSFLLSGARPQHYAPCLLRLALVKPTRLCHLSLALAMITRSCGGAPSAPPTGRSRRSGSARNDRFQRKIGDEDGRKHENRSRACFWFLENLLLEGFTRNEQPETALSGTLKLTFADMIAFRSALERTHFRTDLHLSQ